MLIDWVTASIPMENMPREMWEGLRLLSDRVMRYSPTAEGFSTYQEDGFIRIESSSISWDTSAWDSIRSDSHQLAFKIGGDAIHVQGSPARVIGSGDAVFGEGASRALDLVGCVRRMVVYASGQLGFDLPTDSALWKVSRIDVTANIMLDDLAAVRVALRILRECEGGRYRVSQQAGDTVYWSHRSRLRSGKAYAKGPHIKYMLAKKEYTGRKYSSSELLLIDRLLRLELKLGSQWLRERAGKPWTQLTADDLRAEWHSYFERMIGESSMITEDDVYSNISKAAEEIRLERNLKLKVPTKSSELFAKAAYSFYLLIQKEGWQKARELHSKNGKPNSTYYRNLEVLHRAGLGDADLSSGTVVQLRRKIIECQMIDSWSDFRLAA